MSGIIIKPAFLPAQAFKVAMPLATHWEAATCEEVDCIHYLNGWVTLLPADSDLIPTLKRSGRSFTEERGADGLVKFTFKAGQTCFRSSQHKQQSGRPALYIHGNRETGQSRVVQQSEWHERAVETQETLKVIREG